MIIGSLATLEYGGCCHESCGSSSDDGDCFHRVDYIETYENTKNNTEYLQDAVFLYNTVMQKDSWDIIGTHISIEIDTSTDCTVLFLAIRRRLEEFELKYSRFIE